MTSPLISPPAVPHAAKRAALLETLARPLQQPPAGSGVVGQSLARGSAGIALWHIECAHADVGARQRVHTWVRTALAEPVSTSAIAGLFAGLPAIAFLLDVAETVIPDYRSAVEKCHAHLIRLTHRRVTAAMARIDRGELPGFAEYDLLHGLTGIGQLLLHFLPGTDALARVLTYLVRLTEPLRIDGDLLPGWWVAHDPDPLLPTPGGHTNLGLAHGISGPLALLAMALRAGITVDGHREAIDIICAHLDRWRCHTETGCWWPYWINRGDYARGGIEQTGPGRPSWCYGTPGITRACQLAALATRDTSRQRTAEAALAACLADEVQLDLITDLGLCHGWAGLYCTVGRAAADADNPALAAQLPHLAQRLIQHAAATRPPDHGLLDGTAGIALALSAITDNGAVAVPRSGWDRCLLIA
ncbi:lanthionine synthetase [Amycolatopsis rhizosphaerae]|uniref:Lanthionine synthetase n=1 Tax=Amycolatopsis rhizosphaerae TaxID=2053003 RepID=A0A558DLW9_9PSEU|nr:lanthionine synthetase C family protein [Amycolatopsis rhizosphaerae]TVT61974.1 lanthionine synthetase [Amycolatopsis rhizosphaerae]